VDVLIALGLPAQVVEPAESEQDYRRAASRAIRLRALHSRATPGGVLPACGSKGKLLV